MRLIAESAGVSLGNAYYYFRSKDDLVHAFYARLQQQELAAAEGILATEKNLKLRLTGAIRSQLALCAPYQRLFISLFRVAGDPDSPLSPFSSETSPVRDQAIAHYKLVLDGSDAKVPADLQEELPQLLWLYHMGIILFWIHDKSPHFVRTYRMIELSADLVCGLIGMASVPVLAPLRKAALRLLASLKEV
jgi:AcrR family transcriptional regulator